MKRFFLSNKGQLHVGPKKDKDGMPIRDKDGNEIPIIDLSQFEGQTTIFMRDNRITRHFEENFIHKIAFLHDLLPSVGDVISKLTYEGVTVDKYRIKGINPIDVRGRFKQVGNPAYYVECQVETI